MAIIGNGDVASAIKSIDVPDLLFFASGVSNSQETRESEYKREEKLLMDQDKFKHIVYFSSLSVFYAHGRYQKHKLHMEKLVKTFFPLYTIIRLGNIDWGTNPNTLINYLRHKIENGEDYEVQDVYRFVISKFEFRKWIRMIPGWSCEMNLPGRMLKVSEIVEEYIEK